MYPLRSDGPMAPHCDNARTHLRCNSGRYLTVGLKVTHSAYLLSQSGHQYTTGTTGIRPGLKKCSEPWIKLRCLSPRVDYIDRLSDRHLLEKLVPTFADRGCRVVSAAFPSDRNLGFLDRSRYFFFHVASQLYSHS
jgi:hypothetical protein